MTAPVREEVELDSMEQAQAPKLSDIKIEGDDVPEHLRGKSAAEVLEYVKKQDDALKLSVRATEDARAQMVALTSARETQPPRAEGADTRVAPVEEPKDKTPEELAEMMKDPAKVPEALAIMQEQTTRRVTKQFEQRLGPLTSSGASGAEQRARQRHPEAFKHLEKEIMASASKAPDKAILNNDDIWDDVVAHALGKNFKKFEEARATEAAKKLEQDALNEASQSAGFSGTQSTQRSAVSTSAKGSALTEDEKRVAKTLGMTDAEYNRWKLS